MYNEVTLLWPTCVEIQDEVDEEKHLALRRNALRKASEKPEGKKPEGNKPENSDARVCRAWKRGKCTRDDCPWDHPRKDKKPDLLKMRKQETKKDAKQDKPFIPEKVKEFLAAPCTRAYCKNLPTHTNKDCKDPMLSCKNHGEKAGHRTHACPTLCPVCGHSGHNHSWCKSKNSQ